MIRLLVIGIASAMSVGMGAAALQEEPRPRRLLSRQAVMTAVTVWTIMTETMTGTAITAIPCGGRQAREGIIPGTTGMAGGIADKAA